MGLIPADEDDEAEDEDDGGDGTDSMPRPPFSGGKVDKTKIRIFQTIGLPAEHLLEAIYSGFPTLTLSTRSP